MRAFRAGEVQNRLKSGLPGSRQSAALLPPSDNGPAKALRAHAKVYPAKLLVVMANLLKFVGFVAQITFSIA
jgi:hypothetical protein